ncbi:hypothetical protein LguiA_026104 [Lonicera macranthoides]
MSVLEEGRAKIPQPQALDFDDQWCFERERSGSCWWYREITADGSGAGGCWQ